jgi:hypothetical protein
MNWIRRRFLDGSDPHDIALFVVVFVLAHIIFVAAYTPLSSVHSHTFEQWAIQAAMTTAALFYAIWVILTTVWAERTRLNLALGFQKFYWFLLISGWALPAVSGWYTPVPNGVRTYAWLGIACATPWVIYELCRANGWVDAIWRVIYCVPQFGLRCWERRPSRRTQRKESA